MKSEYQGAAMSRSIYTFLSRLMVFGCIGLIAGCMRSASETVLAEDGTWTKTVKLSVQTVSMGQDDKVDLKTLVKFDEPGWTVTVAKKGEEEELTATKKFAAGESAGMTLRDGDKDLIHSAATVSGGSYSDTWTWKGKDMSEETKKVEDGMKSILSSEAGLSGDALGVAAHGVTLDLWKILWGPSDPAIAGMLHSDRMNLVVSNRLYGEVVKRLTTAGVADPKSSAKKVVEAVVKMNEKMAEDKQQAGQSEDKFALVSIEVSVKAPGKDASSNNGEMNLVDGSVHWSFFSEAAATGPVTLNAKFGE